MADDDKAAGGEEEAAAAEAAAAEAKGKDDGAGEEKGKPEDQGLAAARAKEKKDAAGEAGEEGKSPAKVDEEGKEIGAKDEKKKPDKVEPYYPKDIPDHLKGDTDKDTIDKMLKQNVGLRKELSQKKGAPEKASDYTVPKGLDLDTEDPVFDVILSAAHEAGISNDAFGSMLEHIGKELVSKDLMDEPFDKAAEMAKLGKNGPAMIDQWIMKLDQLLEMGTINESEYVEGMIMGGTGIGISLLNKLQGSYGERAIPLEAVEKEGEMTEAELYKRLEDPKYKTNPAFQAETTRLFNKRFGKEPAGTSKRGIPGMAGRGQ